MITAAKLTDAATYLGTHLTPNDYFCKEESVVGEWTGKGAEILGIKGERIAAGDRTFERFRRNRLPDGRKMTPRDRTDRIRFIDFQCGAPKSLSILAITLGDARLIEAHRRAATVAHREMESFACCQANTLTERVNRNTGNLTSARFLHTASRALDPHVHEHFVTVGATFDAASKGWRALTEFEIYKAIRYCGKVYQNELARELVKLGYELRIEKDFRHRVIGFEIAGVSPEIIRRYSKRRQQVERGIAHFEAKNGREPSWAEIHVITTQTRDPKLAEVTTPEVIRRQIDQLTPAEHDALTELKRSAMRRAREGVEPLSLGLERDALRRAISHVYERNCVAPGHALLAESLNQGLGGLSLARLKSAVFGPELVPMGEVGDIRRDLFVTPSELRRERWILTVAKEGRGTFTPLAEPVSVSEKLSHEQREAVLALLSCRDRFAVLRGAAGVGKTTVLSEIDRRFREQGRRVAYCAPTASATDTLRKDGLSGAVTLASFLESTKSTPPAVGTVLVVDEAGMASHRDGEKIMRLATSHDLRVVFVGDTKQHSAVEAGDFLRLLESRAGLHRVELVEIRRQTEEHYREAVKLMSVGKAREGLARLDEMGRITEGAADYLQNAAKEYVSAREMTDSVICVTPSWAENHALTAAIRDGLRAAGKLGQSERIRVLEPLSWTAQQKREVKSYAPGQVVVFDKRTGFFAKGEQVEVVSSGESGVTVRTNSGEERPLSLARGGFDVCSPREIEVATGDTLLLRANDKARGLINGTLVEIESVKDGKITGRDGVVIDTKSFGRLSHGYALTSHKSQGKTCDRVIVAAAKLDAKAAYVACSRGRTSCSLHTPDKATLLTSISTGDRALVAEQPGFLSATRGRESARAIPEPVRIASWFPGPWRRALGLEKSRSFGIEVHSEGMLVTQNEKQRTL